MTHSVKYILLVPLGGLCNRLRAIMSAISLARDIQVPLKIIWLRDAGLNARFSDLFNPLPEIPETKVTITDSTAWYFYGVPRLRNLYLPSLLQINAFDTILNEARLAEIINSISTDNLSEAIRRLLCGNVLIQTGLGFYPSDERELQQLFVPSEAVRSFLAKRLEKIDPHTVGLHIRRTDNEQSAKHSPLSAFERAMSADLERDPKTSFYIATDDPTVFTSLSSRFPSCFCCESFPTRSTLSGMQEAVAELFTLIACPRFHGSYWSSFSDTVVVCHEEGTADIIFNA